MMKMKFDGSHKSKQVNPSQENFGIARKSINSNSKGCWYPNARVKFLEWFSRKLESTLFIKSSFCEQSVKSLNTRRNNMYQL